MKKVLAAALATMFMLASVPAFACDGHDKAAKKGDDDTLMTSVDDGEKVDAKKTDKAKKARKTKEAKKEAKADENEGEV